MKTQIKYMTVLGAVLVVMVVLSHFLGYSDADKAITGMTSIFLLYIICAFVLIRRAMPDRVEPDSLTYEDVIRILSERVGRDLSGKRWVLVSDRQCHKPEIENCRNAVVLYEGNGREAGFAFGGDFIEDFNLINCRTHNLVLRYATPEEIVEAYKYSLTLQNRPKWN